jgi:hypothetical protein
MAIKQVKLAIPFVVDSSNPSPSKGWSEEHITKTKAWYKAMASWALGHVERAPIPTTQDATISLVEEWDFSNRGLGLTMKAYKVGVWQGGSGYGHVVPHPTPHPLEDLTHVHHHCTPLGTGEWWGLQG